MAKVALANNTNYDHETYFYPTPEIMNSAEDYEPAVECSFAEGDRSPSYVVGLNETEKSGVWINCITRMRLTLDAVLILKSYPWDTQRAYLSIESAASRSEEVTWLATGSAGLMPPGGANAVAGWKITSAGSSTGIHDYPSLGEKYSSLDYWIIVERIPDYFIVRLPQHF